MSEADYAAERAIRELLAARRPGDAILGEEGGETQVGEGLRWIVDPLDGTVNFLFGVPQWCVSVAVHDDDGGVAGAVFDPLRDELFAAERGGPATLNGTPVGGSQQSELGLVADRDGLRLRGRGARRRRRRSSRACCRAVRDVRRMGSAALDLAWLAGRALRRLLRARRAGAGTSPPARCCASARGSSCARLRLRMRAPSGIVVAPPGLIDELEALVS